MAHWSDYTTRGWLAFLAFMHIGTAFRCFFDQEFLRTKIFITDTSTKDTSFHHVYGAWSALNALILLQSAIYLYVYPVTRLMICSLFLYLVFFLLEALVYKTIHLYGSSFFPFALSGLALVWVIFYHYFWQPWRRSDLDVETEILLKHGLPFHKSNSNRKLRHKDK